MFIRPLIAPLVAAALLLAGCDQEPPRPQRMQTVKLLPDTPPPPPPPRMEEKRPEPRPEQKQQLEPKPQAQPEQQALRSDEAAGDGAGSGLVAGAVTTDYTDQKIGAAPAAPPPAEPSGVNRLAASAYASATTRALNDFLARERQLKQQDYRIAVNVWLEPDGRVQRAELAGSTGDPDVDAALRAALGRFPGTGSPLPERMPQPVRLQVSNRMIG